MNYFGDKFTAQNMRNNTEFMRIKNFTDLPGGNGLPNTLRMTGGMGAWGVIIGTWTLGMNRPANAKVALQRVALTSASCAVLGAAFAASTSIASGIRGKDTPLNYGIGGISAGLLIGVMTKSYAVGSGMAVVFGSTAAFAKHWIIEGWPNGFGKPEY